MNLLFIGDVVGQPGRRAISDQLPTLRQRFKLDLVVANAENIADGAGITRKTANELFAAGVDADQRQSRLGQERSSRIHHHRTAPAAPAQLS
jgi:calcineurin-like phosphoesterase